MASDPEFDAYLSALKYWNQAALLTAHRERLRNPERYPQGESEPPAQPGEGLPPGVPSPPAILYKVITIYRYTRGNNDLANPGMGYGELTSEHCWQNHQGTYRLNEVSVRRTRSARQRIEPGSNRRGSSIVPPPVDSSSDPKDT